MVFSEFVQKVFEYILCRWWDTHVTIGGKVISLLSLSKMEEYVSHDSIVVSMSESISSAFAFSKMLLSLNSS